MTLQGTIKNYRTDRQYGFIRAGDTNYFVHRNQLVGDWVPEAGDRVKFVGRESERRPGKHEAHSVELVREDAHA